MFFLIDHIDIYLKANINHRYYRPSLKVRYIWYNFIKIKFEWKWKYNNSITPVFNINFYIRNI